MKLIPWGPSALPTSAIALGCMRLERYNAKEAAAYIETAMDCGIRFFDHADIYGAGRCESLFGEAFALTGINREDVWVQSKCGIVSGVMYDFSKEHILTSVDGILKRLNMEYLDSLLLHRPDALMEPEEVAETFDILQSSGKVRHFGVSNHRPSQMELMKKFLHQPLVVDQMQLSIAFSGMIASGMETNMETEGSVDHDGDVLNHCRLHDITIQTWSPFQYGCFAGPFLGNLEKYPDLNRELEKLAGQYETTPTAIAAAWILRHPAKFQMIAGTTSKQRMGDILRGSEITLTRPEWYRLYLCAGHILP